MAACGCGAESILISILVPPRRWAGYKPLDVLPKNALHRAGSHVLELINKRLAHLGVIHMEIAHASQEADELRALPLTPERTSYDQAIVAEEQVHEKLLDAEAVLRKALRKRKKEPEAFDKAEAAMHEAQEESQVAQVCICYCRY